MIDSANSLVGFVYVFADKLSVDLFGELFYISYLNCPAAFCQRLFFCS